MKENDSESYNWEPLGAASRAGLGDQLHNGGGGDLSKPHFIWTCSKIKVNGRNIGLKKRGSEQATLPPPDLSKGPLGEKKRRSEQGGYLGKGGGLAKGGGRGYFTKFIPSPHPERMARAIIAIFGGGTTLTRAGKTGPLAWRGV